MPDTIFHVTTRAQLELARRTGVLAPESLQFEGFVHACFRAQIAGVLERYFRGARDLELLELDAAAVGRTLVERPTGANEGFPHVYGPLPIAAVRRVFPLREEAGHFALPRELLADAERERREVEALLAAYAWYDHPEGPKFVETHRDAHRTSGHWLFLPGAISAFHRVFDSEELWLAQRGRLIVHVIDTNGVHVAHTLGLDVAAGERPVLAIARGDLQAAELPPGEPFAFGTNVCAPPFEFSRFELTPRADLLRRFGSHSELITRLTHG